MGVNESSLGALVDRVQALVAILAE